MKPSRTVPLHVAVDKFATRSALESLDPPLALSPDQQLKPGMTPEEAMRRFTVNIPALTKELFRPATNRNRLFAYLCRRIERGQLVAYGIRTKPNVGEAPEPIPAYLFLHPEWDEDHDAIENAGYRYELIKVGRPSRKTQAAKIVVPEKKMGRPSKEAEILQIVIKALADPSAPGNRLRMCDHVRELARRLGKDVSRGYSDSTIKRLIVRAESDQNRSKVR